MYDYFMLISQAQISRQETRSAETRKRLVDAAIHVLTNLGMSDFNFVKVCKKANLSRGAIHHHYDTPFDLIAEVVEEIYTRLEVSIMNDPRIKKVKRGDQNAFIDVMWAQLRGDLFRVLLEIRAAAASNQTLSKAMAELNDHLSQAKISFIAKAIPATSDMPTIRIIFAALTGLALQYFTLVRSDLHYAEKYANDFIDLLKVKLHA